MAQLVVAPLILIYVVTLADPYCLQKEFGECIGERHQFEGDFGRFRQRHQAIGRSVKDADRFLMLSNGASFCCQVVTIILILYSTIFYRDNSISLDPESTVLYIMWLGFSVCGLALAAGQPILVNHKASSSFVCSLRRSRPAVSVLHRSSVRLSVRLSTRE